MNAETPDGIVPAEVSSGRPRPAYPTWKSVLIWPLIQVSIAPALMVVLIPWLWMHRRLPTEEPMFLALATAWSNLTLIAWCMARGRLRLSQVVGPLRVRPMHAVALLSGVLGAHILMSELDNLLRLLAVDVPNTMPGGFLSDPLWGPIATVVIAPVSEEIIFRGILLRGFAQNYGPTKAVVGSTLLFALFHMNPAQIPVTLLLGAILGLAFSASGSVWLTAAAHGVFNGLIYVASLTLRMVSIRGYNQLNPDGSVPVGFQPWWFDAIGLTLLGLALVGLWPRAVRNRTPD